MQVDNTARETLLVLGASGTLGRALVSLAVRQRAFERVVGCGFTRLPEGDSALQFDALEPGALAALPDRLAKSDCRITAVVSCIGGTRDRSIAQSGDDGWQQVLDLNLRSAFLATRAFLPVFMAQRRGHFVFIGSHAGALGRAGQSSYAAAKAGLVGLCQTIAREYGRRNVQANVVLPGYLPGSPSVAALPPALQDRPRMENALGTPSDLAEAAGFILHLLSMKKVSGQVFALDSRILPQ
jgi:3-oxoacyl-[acyl-carrier protein] reductase